MTAVPTPDDVARTASIVDLPARNREVTRGYYLFSQRLQHYLGQESTWPTMATWASAQAGKTVRKEDLLRALERRLGDSEAIRRLVEGPFRLTARFVLQALLKVNPFERSSQAVSQGNIKVYSEIGCEFARLLALLDAKAPQPEMEAYLAELRPGPPPDGQQYVRQAFLAYLQAMSLPPGKIRSELILMGNVSIGVHEQTRLQPEIEASVDGSIWDAAELKDHLFDLLLPHLGPLRKSVKRAVLRARMEPWLAPVVEEVRRLVREIVTEAMMVLELPGEVLRLGQDLRCEFPMVLRSLENEQARTLLELIDPTPDQLVDSGARNWVDFKERMHFIADLFRSHQLSPRLFERPADVIL